MYNYTDIRWVKNIVSLNRMDWAYDDAGFDKPFDLQWPTSKRGSVLTAPPGEIMLLFQKPERINGKRNYQVMLTHLATPIDTIERPYNRKGFEFGRKMLLIAKPDRMNAIPNLYFNFHKPNRGQTNPFVNLDSTEGLSYNDIQLRVWNLFAPYLNPFLNNGPESQSIAELISSPEGAEEGDIRVIEHIRAEVRQRNQAIVKLAKAMAYQKGHGRILCQCCGFDFIAAYGAHGDGFIECHHRLPIASGARITDVTDLAMVCSNCHKMLHRKKSDGSFYSVEKLEELISNNRREAKN